MRFSAAPLLISLALLAPVSAIAASSSDSSVASSCKNGDKQCVRDTQKKWKKEVDAFERALDAKKKAWIKDHPPVISIEWRQMQQAFSEQIRQEALAFRKAQKEREKAFYDALKEQEKGRGDTRLNATGSARLLPGQETCDQKANPQVYRICMREYRVKYLLQEKVRIRESLDE